MNKMKIFNKKFNFCLLTSYSYTISYISITKDNNYKYISQKIILV